MDDEATTADVLSSRKTAHVFITSLTVWMIVGNFCALVVVFLILKRKKHAPDRAKSTNWVILSLAICDFISGGIGFAGQVQTRGDFGSISHTACRIYGTFLTFSAVVSVQLVLLLGFVRYRILMQNELDKKQVLQYLSIAIFGSAASVVFLGVIDVVEPGPGRSYCFATIAGENIISTIFSWITVISCSIPFGVLIVWYSRAFCNVRNNEEKIGMHPKYSRRIAWMGFAFVVTYLVTILPWTVAVLYRLVGPEDKPISPDADAVVGAFVFINFAMNPVLYFAFQQEYVKMFQRWLLCRSLSSITRSVSRRKKSSDRSDSIISSEASGRERNSPRTRTESVPPSPLSTSQHLAIGVHFPGRGSFGKNPSQVISVSLANLEQQQESTSAQG